MMDYDDNTTKLHVVNKIDQDKANTPCNTVQQYEMKRKEIDKRYEENIYTTHLNIHVIHNNKHITYYFTREKKSI